MKIKIIILVVVIVGAVCVMPGYNDFVQVAAEMKADNFTMVIDPGHGGMDGGAEASDGTQEKDINLAIALCLRDEAKRYGVTVVMTRDTDICLRAEEGGSISTMKIRDIHERKKIIDEISPDITVCIHLNSFKQDASVRGAQVFYPTQAQVMANSPQVNPALTSKEIATLVQTEIEKNVDYEKSRMAMQKDNIYIMKNIYTPIILVECGFLSNNRDKEITQNTKFQQKIAKAIMRVLSQYFELDELKNIEIKDSRQN